MTYFLIFLILTSLILILGIVLFAIGGKFNRKFSSKLMLGRVIFQAIAICLLALAYFHK